MPKPYCHRFFSASSPAKPSLLDPNAKVTMNLVECLGARCAAFVHDVEPDGKPTGHGACADTLQAIGLMKIAQAVEEIAVEVCGEAEEDPPPASA